MRVFETFFYLSIYKFYNFLWLIMGTSSPEEKKKNLTLMYLDSTKRLPMSTCLKRIVLNFYLASLVGWLVGFLTSSSTTSLYRGRAPRQSVWQFNMLPHMRQSWETMTSVSAGHIILTPTQPVGSGRPQRESNPGPPHQESRALPQSYHAPPCEQSRWLNPLSAGGFVTPCAEG